MSTTISVVKTQLNTYIGDSSTDRISDAERYQYITEATTWYAQETMNDHSQKTYTVSYFDGINSYKLNSAITDVFDSNALKRSVNESNMDLTKKDSRQLLTDISESSSDYSYALEWKDGNLYLLVNMYSKYPKFVITDCSSLTLGSGTFKADTVNSDALNLTIDNTDGSNDTTGCFSFDLDVSQSGNNKGSIYVDDLDAEDLSDDKDLSSWFIDVKIPNVSYVTSYTLYWGSDSSNYYSVTSTTNYDSSVFRADDFTNTIKFPWLGATVVGTPDSTAITYLRIDVNYSASQADATSFKIDNIRLIRPEKLTFYYTSWNVGTSSTGTALKAFTADTDIPYYSGQYDDAIYPIAHKAASLAYKGLRLFTESLYEEQEAKNSLSNIKKVIPKSRPTEMKNFKVKGLRFSRRGISR